MVDKQEVLNVLESCENLNKKIYSHSSICVHFYNEKKDLEIVIDDFFLNIYDVNTNICLKYKNITGIAIIPGFGLQIEHDDSIFSVDIGIA